MISWNNISDKKKVFFDGEVFPDNSDFDFCLNEAFKFFINNIVKIKENRFFDVILFQICCDTGRLIFAVGIQDDWEKGVFDGCSVVIQSVQDFWYAEFEKKHSDDIFSSIINSFSLEVGLKILSLVDEETNNIFQCNLNDKFNFIVFGYDFELPFLQKVFLKN